MTNPLTTYIRCQSENIFRSASGQLRYPFLVPGSVYQDDLWDWDSYWCALGLFATARRTEDAALREKTIEHSIGSLRNFFAHQSENGTVPILLRQDNPDVFGCLNATNSALNQAKPVFAQFALAISRERGDFTWGAPLFDPLLRFLDRWQRHYASTIGLLVWANDVAIGMDNDPTTYGRPDRSCASLLLNCLYYEDLLAAAELARRLGREPEAEALAARAREWADLIRQACWDPRDRFFYSVDVLCADHRAEKIPWARPGMPMGWRGLPNRIQMASGFLPLWCGVATTEQAEDLVTLHASNSDSFRARFGIRTLSAREGMFSLAASGNPSNWLGPVWILTNYLTWRGLLRYGFRAQADLLAQATLDLLHGDLAASGVLHEYYNPDTGVGITNAGFLSWNTLAVEMLAPNP